MEDGVPLQQPDGALEAAGGGGEVEAVGGAANHAQRQRRRPRRVQTIDLELGTV